MILMVSVFEKTSTSTSTYALILLVDFYKTYGTRGPFAISYIRALEAANGGILQVICYAALPGH